MKRINDEKGIVCATCGSNDIVYADTGTLLDCGYEIKEGIVYAYKCKKCGNKSFVFYQIAGISRLNKTTLESVIDGKLPEWEDDRKAPALTEEVFYRPDCPKWAQYAAVDFGGMAYWYEHAPIAVGGEWDDNGGSCREIGIYDCSSWFSSVIVRPPSVPTLPEREDNTKAPEFTDAVFSLPDCPDWAQYAAVDSTGVAIWYEKAPSAIFGLWLEISGRTQRIDGIYPGSDWSKSVIARPANTVRLPYWCQHGCYVYSKAKDKYAIITDIAISSAIGCAPIPSTKEYAMIKVIPMVANSKEFKELKGDAKELYKLGIEATKARLKSLALTEDKPENGK